MSDTDTISLIVAGDVMTGRGIDQILAHPGDPTLHEDFVPSAHDYVELAERANGPIPRGAGPDYIWGDAIETLNGGADAVLINLETAITATPDYFPKGINYRMSPQNADVLRAAGIDGCALANNHVLDWGERGLLDTINALNEARVTHAGAGANIEAATAPIVLAIPGKGRVRAYSFALASSGVPLGWAAEAGKPGIAFLPDLSAHTLNALTDRICAEQSPEDLVVVSLHWGANWGYDIDERQIAFARSLIERGVVDLVHGHSSHHPKAAGVHNDRPILFGCGDLINDYEGISGYEAFRPELVLLYRFTFSLPSHRLVAFDLLPFRVANFRLNRANKEQRAWLQQRLNREYGKFGLSVSESAEAWIPVRFPPTLD